MKLHSIRNEYKYASLTKSDIDKNPFNQFEHWLNDALSSKVNEPTAMILATVNSAGYPDSRVVLLKDFGVSGFTFFTNYNSNKGRAIALNPRIGLHFFWPELERQIRISGTAEKTSEDISDKYFNSRPPLSQLAAVVSDQSSKISSRKYLLDLFDKEKVKSENKILKRPENWGGYIVKPVRFEFWQGRENRLHDRILYEIEKDNWIISRLAP